jgi:hypothetical protein
VHRPNDIMASVCVVLFAQLNNLDYSLITTLKQQRNVQDVHELSHPF